MRMQNFRVIKLSCKILKTVFHLRCNTTVVVVVYLSFVVYYAVFGPVISLCLCAVGCSTGCVLVVASVYVVLWCHDVTTAESRVKVWRL